MSDAKAKEDLTTKVCRWCGGTGNTALTLDEYPKPECPDCHGTGRVPMDTGELLEALRIALPWPHGFDLTPYDDVWAVEKWLWDKGAVYYNANSKKFNTPDDALRAALREVNNA
jgi:hypothetical protein